ncbi:TonB-dependent receptor domain-containing protein [Perlucidibaca aquatica]|uniref:TonB-dependent receptor domain-containing protein n=1 Tax=Perlucidibaca aquatica TaxID=1852776 RepID=UPI00083A6720|nr:TonB-dependent receptor [Perlucidibaca aquatica]
MKFLPFALAPVALAISVSAHATDTTSALNEVVVTASRAAENTSEISASTTVITREDIEARQSVSLAQLLSLAGGIDVASNGAPGASTSVFMRGTNSNHVLVLIDGVRANTANDGRFDFSLLRPEDIDRIEIVRGARSAQYGSDAIGGVIQIFTRKTSRNFVAIKAGSFKTQELQAGVGISKDLDYLSLTSSYADLDGFSARKAPSNQDRDGQHSKSAQINAGKQLGEKSMLQFNAIYQDRQVEFDQGLSDEQLSNARVAFSHATTANWQQTLELGYNRVERDNTLDASRLQGSWVTQVNLGKAGNLIAGIDYQQEEINTGDFGYDKTIQSHGGFVTIESTLQKLGINASARRDEHERFGGHNTGSLTLTYPVANSLRAYGTVASAFKAPTAEQLFSLGFNGFCEEDGDFDFDDFGPCFVGNPALQPEKSKQRELGLRWQVAQQHTLTTNVYDNEIRGLITNDFAFPNNYINLNRARIKGVELTAQGKHGIFNYQINANSLKAKDDNGDDLLRRPRGGLNGLFMLQPSSRWSVGTEVIARSHAKDFGNSGIERVPGYTLVNLLGQWKATPQLTLGLRADNVTDKQYAQVIGFNTADRSGYVTARYSF